MNSYLNNSWFYSLICLRKLERSAVSRLLLAGLLALLASLSFAASREGKLDEALVNPGHHEQPEWFKASFLDLREDVHEAKGAGKRVILYFFQDGCPYCAKLLDVNFTQKNIVDYTREHFEVIALNMWGDREVQDMAGKSVKEKDFAVAQRVMFTPTLLFLDEHGAVALRVNGYYEPHRFLAALQYVHEQLENKISFRDYFEQKNPKAAEGKLHQEKDFLKPPLNLAKQLVAGKPLMVLFEQKQCPACDELHRDILMRKESQALLKEFDVALVDIWAQDTLTTPDGKKYASREWAGVLDIKYTPTAVFFDDSGKEVFRWEAYLKSFHVQSSMDYVASRAYLKEASFQRFIEARGDKLREQGIKIELMQ